MFQSVDKEAEILKISASLHVKKTRKFFEISVFYDIIIE